MVADGLQLLYPALDLLVWIEIMRGAAAGRRLLARVRLRGAIVDAPGTEDALAVRAGRRGGHHGHDGNAGQRPDRLALQYGLCSLELPAAQLRKRLRVGRHALQPMLAAQFDLGSLEVVLVPDAAVEQPLDQLLMVILCRHVIHP